MSFGRYIRAALFNPWNLLALGGAVVAGLVLRLPHLYWPAVAAAEIVYLFCLTGNARFQNLIKGMDAKNNAQRQEDLAVMQLKGDGQHAFHELKRNCEATLGRIASVAPAMVEMHREELAKLAGIYLQLLAANQALKKSLDSAAAEGSFDTLIATLNQRLADPALAPEVKESVEAQRDILTQRQTALAEATQKLTFTQAELTRIEQQVKLLRDQVTASTAPDQVTERIAEISATLRGTTRWIGQQKSLLGTDDSAPPVTLQAPAVKQ